jgi:hypothetical protein
MNISAVHKGLQELGISTSDLKIISDFIERGHTKEAWESILGLLSQLELVLQSSDLHRKLVLDIKDIEAIAKGKARLNYRSGNIYREFHTKGGKRHGPYVTFSQAGKMVFRCSYRNGVMVGLHESFLGDFLYRYFTLNEDQKYHGEYFECDPNSGLVKTHVLYNNGVDLGPYSDKAFMRMEMRNALDIENYELAAKLRDRIAKV